MGDPTAKAELSFTIPDTPPSWNHSYRIAKQYVRNQGGLTYNADGTAKQRMTLAKTEDAKVFSEMVEMIVKTARPSGWQCPKNVYVVYRLFMKRQMDCDNVLKMTNDAIARALGVDDKRFLPVVVERQVGVSPRMEVSIYDAGVTQVRISGHSG